MNVTSSSLKKGALISYASLSNFMYYFFNYSFYIEAADNRQESDYYYYVFILFSIGKPFFLTLFFFSVLFYLKDLVAPLSPKGTLLMHL